MGKGQVWVNGHAVGRYWDTYYSSGCDACPWSGAFFSDKCLVNCGAASQEYYHVPQDWIISSDGKPRDTQITLFEERGGDPTGIQLILLHE